MKLKTQNECQLHLSVVWMWPMTHANYKLFKLFRLWSTTEWGRFWQRCTCREGVNVESHVLFFSVGHVQQIRSYGTLRRIRTEIQHHHPQNGHHDSYRLVIWHVSYSKTWDRQTDTNRLASIRRLHYFIQRQISTNLPTHSILYVSSHCSCAPECKFTLAINISYRLSACMRHTQASGNSNIP